jgi:hypothetical protein
VLSGSSIYNRDPAAAALSLTRRSSEQAPALQQAQQPQSSPFIDAAQTSTPAQPSTCATSPAQQPNQHDSDLQSSISSSAVAAGAAAVAAGAAAVAATASAHAGVAAAGTPPAPAAAAGSEDSPAALQLLQSQHRQQSLLQQQQSLQRGQSSSVATSDDMPVQDPMVEMLLQQVC